MLVILQIKRQSESFSQETPDEWRMMNLFFSLPSGYHHSNNRFSHKSSMGTKICWSEFETVNLHNLKVSLPQNGIIYLSISTKILFS